MLKKAAFMMSLIDTMLISVEQLILHTCLFVRYASTEGSLNSSILFQAVGTTGKPSTSPALDAHRVLG